MPGSGAAPSASAAKPVSTATLPVVEKFVSVNGEGRNAGKLAAFIRFAGCNLACSYCDTTWANVPDVPLTPLSVEDIVAFVRATGVRYVTLTGGEPALQPLLPALVRELAQVRVGASDGARGDGGANACDARGACGGDRAKAGLAIEIETNGAVDLRELSQVRDACANAPGSVSFTMDFKCPSSGMESRMLPSNFGLLTAADTVKFVMGSQTDMERMLEVVRAYDLCSRCAVYLSPVFGKLDPADIVAFMQEHSLTRATVQVQLHKIIWPDVERGV